MKKRNRKNPMRNSVQVRMDDTMYEQVTQEAEKRKVSPAELIREILKRLIK